MGVRVGPLRAECSSFSQKEGLGLWGWEGRGLLEQSAVCKSHRGGGLLVLQALYPIPSSHQEPLVLRPLDDPSGYPRVCSRLRHKQIPNNSVMQQPPTLGMERRVHFSVSPTST